MEASNSLSASDRVSAFHYNRKSPKRRRFLDHLLVDSLTTTVHSPSYGPGKSIIKELKESSSNIDAKLMTNSDDWSISLPKLVAVLCQQNQFLPLLKAFEMFLPSCPLLPFIRALQVC